MQVPAFLEATPLKLRFSFKLAPHRTTLPTPSTTTHTSNKRQHTLTCGLSNDFATAAAAAVTLSLSCLPLRPKVTDAVAHPYHQAEQSVFIVRSSLAHHMPNQVAVVGVGKAAIHDYGPYGHSHVEASHVEAPVTHATVARSVDHRSPLDDEARREFSTAVRLVTAVLLGVMLGAERRATSFNLGVRSVTLISLCTSMISLMATGGEMTGWSIPFVTVAPQLAVLSAAVLAGLTAYAAARMRRRRTRHMASMSWTIALGVGMGGACGAGLSLLTVACYLAAIAVMRADSPRKTFDPSKRVIDSSVVRSGSEDALGLAKSVAMPLDPLINLRHGEGIDGPGLSM